MDATASSGSLAAVERMTWDGTRASDEPDVLVREEPLEIRIHGAPVAVLMRTPGRDEDLVRGFLITERIAPGAEGIRSIRPCTIAETPETEGNVMQVRLAPEVDFDLARFRRNLYASSSCGLCGKASITQALDVAGPLPAPTAPTVAPSRLARLVPEMRRAQVLFDHTGGLHAAAAFDRGGRLLTVAEDIGRHNAVDKVVGRLAVTGEAAEILVVSGRISFEIAQKALAARIPVLVAVSAPSALAVELARASNMTLVAFARGDRHVVYADPGHLAPHLQEVKCS
jgi:FdhD protein